jgi:RNA polymerase sigma-70 factor (ECF subfamily)
MNATKFLRAATVSAYLTLGGMLPAWSSALAQVAGESTAPGAALGAVEERGQAVLKQFVEANRYWLVAPPETVTNYAYVFHLLWDEPSLQQVTVRVTEPARTPQPRRQGITYYSVLQCLARDPRRAQVREVTEEEGKITLMLALLPPAESGGKRADPVTGSTPASLSAERPFQGECGNGIRGGFRGYFTLGGTEARVVLEARRLAPLQAFVRLGKSDRWTEESFSDWAEVDPQHFAPLNVTVKNGGMEFAWKFKLHPGGLWLLDESQFGGAKVAWVEKVVVNRPVAELPAETPPLARKARAATPKRPPEYQHLATNSVEVAYAGISAAYAEAIAQVIAVARETAQGQFGFDMPEVISITVTAEQGRRLQLFNDGQDHFELELRSEAGLQRPSRTGTYHIYGFCHEVGHLAMYRVRDFDWMSADAKEAWAHYLGSRLTDVVYEKRGPGLWPDSYDYRADGMQRLGKQLTSTAELGAQDRAARAWKELAELVGDKGVAPLFAAWAAARTDALNPGAAIGQTLAGRPDSDRLAAWWAKSAADLVLRIERSDFPARQVAASALAQQVEELAFDDGKPAGQRSIAGSGHAVRFQAKDAEGVLTEVRMFGSRYGLPQPPKEDFHVWLCDKNFKPIADFPFPYSTFPHGDAADKWVSLKVPPTRVPPEFILCVCFNPTATKGIYAHFDQGPGVHSFTALPGGEHAPFTEGNWLIRAELDRPKTAQPAGQP